MKLTDVGKIDKGYGQSGVAQLRMITMPPNKDKWAHNLDRLLADKGSEFIYVPVQFGQLSQRTRRVKLIDKATIIHNGKPTVFKLYEIAPRNMGEGRRLVWFHRVIKKDRLGQTLEFDIVPDNPHTWRGVKAIEKKQIAEGVHEQYEKEAEQLEKARQSRTQRARRGKVQQMRNYLNKHGRREVRPVRRKELVKN